MSRSDSFTYDCGPMDRSLEHSGRHWHQPALPYELIDPMAAIAAAVNGVAGRLRALRQHVAMMLSLWAERARSRRELEELSEHTLRDIGLTRADVWREATKPWWRE